MVLHSGLCFSPVAYWVIAFGAKTSGVRVKKNCVFWLGCFVSQYLCFLLLLLRGLT